MIALACIVLLSGAVALNPDPASAARSASVSAPVPSTAVVAARIDWQAVRRRPSLAQLVRVEPVRLWLRLSDISDEQVTSITVFSDLNPTGASALIVSGTFDRARTLAHLRETGWNGTEVRGRTVLRRGSAEAATLLRAGLVIGTPDGVASAIGAATSASRRVSPSSRFGRVLGVASRGSLGVAISLRESTDDAVDLGTVLAAAMLDVAGFGPASAVLERLATVRAFGVSITDDRDFVNLDVTAVLRDTGAARSAAESFGLLKTSALYLSGTPSSDRERAAKQMIESLRIEARGTVLSLFGRMPHGVVPR